MGLAKFRWRRLAAALGIGLGVEVLAFFALIVTANFLPPQWADVIGEWPLQPASYLVTLLAKVGHPGFEGQVGYFLLAVVLQWLIYSAVIYLLLAILGRLRSADGASSLGLRKVHTSDTRLQSPPCGGTNPVKLPRSWIASGYADNPSKSRIAATR